MKKLLLIVLLLALSASVEANWRKHYYWFDELFHILSPQGEWWVWDGQNFKRPKT